MNKRPKVSSNTVKRLLSYIFHYKLRFFFVLICILISALTNVASSLYIETLIDDYISPLLLDANPVFDALLRSILTMACVYAVGIICSLLYNRLMVTIAQGVLKDIRDTMFSHMQTLPIRYFDTHTHGDIMSHYTNDTDTLRQMISQSIPQMFSSLITVIAVFCAMLSVNVWLTLVIVVCITFILNITKFVAGRSSTYFIRQQASIGDVNGYIEEMMNGQKVIKVFCHEEAAKDVFNEKNDNLCGDATAANMFANVLMPIMNNLGHLQYVLVAIIGGALALNGVSGLTLGAIASFLQLTKSFNGPISQISQQLNAVIMALAGAERIFKLMDEVSEEDDGEVTLVNVRYKNGELEEVEHRTELWAWKVPNDDGSFRYEELKGEVRFYDVDFGYTEEKIVLHNITLYAEPGQKVAFVGATGAGKTTITNLINRFYDIADGKIRYDGININKIKKADLRRSLGIVLQDVNLFTGTVMENIRYGNLEATDEECIAAAKLANADSFIRRLPQGYDTILSGDGSGLSQGQRQLISIARAAVADPPVMILDEATSSIDTRTEAIVQKGMDRLMLGRTVFVIAHRLSTVQNSDVIMVLEQGNIIERGPHDDLIAQKGKYYQLYTGAFELE
ncbi:ABC transporter transmembrane domain-containing protein [Frisingicoccus sp.]|uniref:ABC transporter ATP-binding protein n=1 Tax=Frisingicoccus sp. TaxID=1918627 RepID=UPI0015BD56F3